MELHYPKQLPISTKRSDIVKLIRENQVIVLAGETGSGKTTQIPKFCLEAGRGQKGKIIGCTQPRRLAAVSVAARIAEEMKENLGGTIGYKIRFDEKTSSKTKVKLMTDGVLLAETQSDRLLSRYDTIIVDEAHERSLNIDFLLGILRGLIKKRKDLKIIITSATIDTQKFSQAFDDAPIIEVSGRTFPVEVRYRPPSEEEGETSLAESGADALEEILLDTNGGDVLIFMPTEQDIVECCDLINTRYSRWQLNVLPLYARLTSGEQHRIFENSTRRKIVVSTNVAETSLTIPGIVYVIDTGVARIARYTPSTGTFGLPIESISRSSADQRMGRCGRIEDGICIRLYSEEDYNGRTLYTPPEVLRTNLAEVILRMLSLKIYDVENFPFVDPPQGVGIRDGFKTLEELRAIKEVDNRSQKDNAPKQIKLLTREGYRMAQLPMDPRLAKMILQSEREGCPDEALILAGALSIHDPRERPSDKQGQADQKHAVFRHDDSDFLTLINIWQGWQKIGDNHMKLGALKKYCKENYLSFKRMREWRDLYRQFKSILAESSTLKNKSIAPFKGNEETLFAAVHKSVLSGFLSHISQRKDRNFYEATRRRETMIFPGSGLFKKGGEWLVSAEMVRTSRLYMRVNANIKPEWISQIGSHMVKRNYIKPWWEDQKGEILCKEEEKIFGFLLSRDKTVPYGQYKPKEAAEMFIRDGLCGEGTFKGKEPSFLKKNRRLWHELSTMEDKLRRRDLLQDTSFMESFYGKAINQLSQAVDKPQVIYDIRQLNRLIREKGDKELIVDESDLLAGEADEYNAENYPDYFIQDDEKFSLEYKFNPGEDDDGVTLRVPRNKAPLLDPSRIRTTVPGKDRELLSALIKGLPKEKRKKLIPVNAHVDELLSQLDMADDSASFGLPLTERIAPIIYRLWGVNITPAEWDEGKIPDYLKMRFALVDKKNRVVKTSRDKSILFEKQPDPVLGENQEKSLKAKWERTSLPDWSGLDIPERISQKNRGETIYLFPALKRNGRDVDLRLFANRQKAEEEHRNGTASLFRKVNTRVVKSFIDELDLNYRAPREIIYLGGAKEMESLIWDRVFLDLFGNNNCRRESDFEALRKEKASRIYVTGELYYKKILTLMEHYGECRRALSKARTGLKKGREQFIEKREMDLNDLIPSDFPLKYDNSRWNDLVRYIRTLKLRIEKGIHDPLTDNKRDAEFAVYQGKYDKIAADLSIHASEEKKQAVEDLYWLVQEYRVALFGAGVVKTGCKVSPQRLEKKISAVLSIH